MTDFQVLNPDQHKGIKVITEHSAEYGDAVRSVTTFPFEFRNMQGHYPLLISKNHDSGETNCIALLGFEEGENLFLNEQGWNASYVPLMIQRQPFLIGFQKQGDNAESTPIVTIDMDNPRVNQDQGEPLFFDHGGQSEFLQQSMSRLEYIHQAHQHESKFIAKLQELDLIEDFALDIKLDKNQSSQLLGFSAINEQNLQQLNGDQFAELNEQGFLQPIFMMLASQSRIGDLVRLKQARLAAA